MAKAVRSPLAPPAAFVTGQGYCFNVVDVSGSERSGVGLPSYQCDVKRMRMIRVCVRGLDGPSYAIFMKLQVGFSSVLFNKGFGSLSNTQCARSDRHQ